MEEGKFYHIYNRRNNKEDIFIEKKNYYHFLSLFNKYLDNYIEVYSYCLMPNHFHFLIKIKESTNSMVVLKTTVLSSVLSSKLTPIIKAFRDFFIAYSKSINKSYNRTGALFQQKFKRKEIINDGYFTSIVQYIHANPLEAKLCNDYVDWEFSSYNAIVLDTATKIKREYVLEWFGGKERFIKIHIDRKIEKEKLETYLEL